MTKFQTGWVKHQIFIFLWLWRPEVQEWKPAGLVFGETAPLSFKRAICLLCPYIDYITLLFIYFVPETMHFYSPNESSPYLFQGFCTCCCLSRKFLPWLFALLALSHHPAQLKWHVNGEDFITFNDYHVPATLSQYYAWISPKLGEYFISECESLLIKV